LVIWHNKNNNKFVISKKIIIKILLKKKILLGWHFIKNLTPSKVEGYIPKLDVINPNLPRPNFPRKAFFKVQI
jgi:hypothetical protein